MNPRTAGLEPEHFPVFLDRLVVGALALLGLARGQMPPHRVGGDLRKLPHGQESEVPVDFARLIENLRVIGVQTVEFHRDFHGVLVTLQARVCTFELQAAHPLDIGVSRMTEACFQARQCFVVAARLRQ